MSVTDSDVLRGGGEMGALMRAFDWSKTAVGPVHTWPQSLRTALSILLETGFPMYIAWGPSFTQFYNDGYRPILGSTKHPHALGASTFETFAEIWDIIGPMFAGVMQGTPTTVVDFLLPLDRHGFIEECYFIFSYSPIRQENGQVGGVLVTVTETTQRVLGERRLKTTQALAARTRDARSVPETCRIAARVLDESADLPFACIYLVTPDGTHARLEGSSGRCEPFQPPTLVPLQADAGAWPFASVLRRREPQLITAHGERALILPIVQQGVDEPMGLFVAGISPRLMLDQPYREFLTLVASQIGTAVASARALEEAKARADALAELDRAKTAFFNNVSHEFRTPLTLLLGPTEAALASGGTLRGEELESVHRNALRLLKLVNTLLDFSRIEAGRVQAVFEPTDLSTLTADLASAFRSATQRAGLDLVVDCPPLPEPVYVDREMWEKVVLNLISNAFKFTFAGRIQVSLAHRGSHVELVVADTGVGILEADLPHVFERFRRGRRTQARTHEGSGIGLALVRELVTMHGGTIRVDSKAGEGATFTVSIPTGCGHLPPEHVAESRSGGPSRTLATPYVQEALRWLPSAPAVHAEPHVPSHTAEMAGRILVADDNADMREYITRLLGQQWHVQAVSDGAEALAAAVRDRPDVIVSDVMMPGLDGFELLRALRDDERTRSVPVILLSARAGEEARVEGLRAGADDYLVKPFAARELIARVQAQVVRAKVRSIEEEHGLLLSRIFEHAPVGCAFLRGPDHVFDFANQSYLAMVGHRPVAGLPFREALPELVSQGVVECLDRVYATGEPYAARSMRRMLDRGNGPEETFFDLVYHPLTGDGMPAGIAIVCYDVTELVTARREAEAANRAKDEFLAMLGHELRNPLAPILTALQLMRLRGVSAAARERTVIERQVRHVVGLVDDLLDVSRITRGKVQLRRELVDLADAVARAIEMTSPAMDERRHTLHVDVPRGLVTVGDPARLAQVLANLLTNAAKYTDAGGRIEVQASRSGTEIAVSVKDNGAGIAPEMMPRIFDSFSQERQELDRSQGGLGLGLAIVRGLVEAHGGSVSAHSEGKGCGATFTVRLQAAEAHAPVVEAAQPAREPQPGGCEVLLVDDNPDAAALLADSLRALGHAVHVCGDGPSAIEVLRTISPDVALLDLGLPLMDGFELAQRLRGNGRLNRLGLIAVTGYGQEVDLRRSREAGFQGHLVKPVDVHVLDAMIRSIARKQDREEAAG
ncbi:MAG TPA: ATP-binding protein [Vicinamibacterales bacterium]